jgi:hypothetical protein
MMGRYTDAASPTQHSASSCGWMGRFVLLNFGIRFGDGCVWLEKSSESSCPGCPSNALAFLLPILAGRSCQRDADSESQQ